MKSLRGNSESASIQILDFQVEHDVMRDQEFLEFLRFMNQIQLSGIFGNFSLHFLCFPWEKILTKILLMLF